jgi:hypothetical protein
VLFVSTNNLIETAAVADLQPPGKQIATAALTSFLSSRLIQNQKECSIIPSFD